MWQVKVRKQLVHAGSDFKTAYRFAKTFKGQLTFKP